MFFPVEEVGKCKHHLQFYGLSHNPLDKSKIWDSHSTFAEDSRRYEILIAFLMKIQVF
jgi:hypothetical protein